jgi:tetratricopeptide (TPR) repeat protein
VSAARRSFALVLLAATALACDPAAREARRGVRLYEAGEWAAAYAAFDSATAASGDPAIAYNAGNALYQMHRYHEAARRFRQAAEGPAPLRQRSYFNLGNSLVRAAEGARDRRPLLERGVAAYESALRLQPADSAAKWNLELALRRLAEEDKSPGSGGRDRRGGAGANDQRNEGYEGDPETAVGAMAGGGFGSAEGESAKELSEAQARQLLEAVEREQLSTHRELPATRANAGQLDW